jgi:tetratricopeptide (TPR) repeat protein
MAPEQHEGGTADARSDQYALCVVLWEALYGQRPFERAKGALVQSKERAPPQRPASSVPEWLHAVIVRGLALEPDERWPSVDALVDALQRGQSRARWRGGLGFAGMLGISALAFGGWLQFDRQHRIAGCERAGESIEQVWNDEARDRLRTAFLGSGVSHAEVTAGKVMPWLDAQTRGWQTARIEVCLGAEVRGTWDIDVLDRGLWCLDERRMELEALVTELSRPEARNVEKAVQAVAELGQLESCQDVDLLRRTSTPPKERRDEIRVARAELSKAMALRRTGAYEEGLAVARDALSHAQTLEWPPLVAEAHNQLGVLLEFAGDYARAEETLEAGYFLATEAGAPGPALVAATRLVHTVGHRLAQHEQGFRWSRHAKATLVSVPDLAQMREADLLSNLANVHYSAGSYDEAQTLHERALAIRERALGPQHPRVASSLNNLASLHAVTGSYDQAKVLFERALTIWQETLGPEHPHVATTFSNLAGVHFSTGSYEKARTLNERALAIREKALRPDHPDIAASLNNLASVHHATGSWQEAKTLHERGLAIKERALGPEHPDVAMGLDNLARVHFSTGGYEDAKMLHQRALALREKALGPAHPHLAETLVGLGRVALAQRRASEAVSLARRAVGLREDGKSPPAQVAEARFVLAQALWEANEDRTRAVEVAELARDDYQDLGNTSQLAEVDAWLAEHGGAP